MNPSLCFFLPEHEYMELEFWSVELQGAHEAGGAPQGVGAPCTLVDRVWPPDADSFTSIFIIISKTCLREFSGHSKNLYFYTKITPW